MSNIVIVGSGPAGVSAALYAVRAGVQTTVLTKGLRGAGARRKKSKIITASPSRSPGRSWNAAASRTPGGWGCNSCRPRPWG